MVMRLPPSSRRPTVSSAYIHTKEHAALTFHGLEVLRPSCRHLGCRVGTDLHHCLQHICPCQRKGASSKSAPPVRGGDRGVMFQCAIERCLQIASAEPLPRTLLRILRRTHQPSEVASMALISTSSGRPNTCFARKGISRFVRTMTACRSIAQWICGTAQTAGTTEPCMRTS